MPALRQDLADLRKHERARRDSNPQPSDPYPSNSFGIETACETTIRRS